MSIKLNIESLKSLVKTRRDNTIFLSKGSYSGKIFPDKSGNLISNEIRVYVIPTRSESGDIVSRSFRYYEGNPIETALKSLAKEGYLGGSAWRYEARPMVKFYFYVVDAPSRKDGEIPNGPHLAILTGSRKIGALKDFLNKFLFPGAKSGNKKPISEEDLLRSLKKVESYFDPSFPNYGFEIYIQEKSEGSGVVVVPRTDLEIPAFEVPDWCEDVNTAYIDSRPEWTPTPEYEAEVKKATASFVDLAIEGLLNPKASEEVASRRRANSTTYVSRPSSSKLPPFEEGEEGDHHEVLTLPPQPASEAPRTSSATPSSGIEIRNTEEDLDAPRYPPTDPRSGGPDVILLDKGQIPLCFGHFDSRLAKCRACTSARYCAAAS